MATVHEKERSLQREIGTRVESALPEVEVLAVELSGPERFTVFIDRVGGRVDHALCERVTNELRDYLREYTVDVSSPGVERPLRKAQHFRGVVGRRVALRTESRKRLRGEVVDASDATVTVQTDNESVKVPYGEILRGNLIDER
jgi:ribosome maturation factor RimP